MKNVKKICADGFDHPLKLDLKEILSHMHMLRKKIFRLRSVTSF